MSAAGPPAVNPPGLAAPVYRSGTRDVVLGRALAALVERLPALTVSDPEDPAVALLDAWATVADVVTFYQERIAHEGFLRTATERRSVLELARAIGYESSPGVAASAHLAFTVEDAPGAPGRAVLPAGTRVQSVPGQGERPQVFETAREIVALAARNAMRLRVGMPAEIAPDATTVRLAGVTTGLATGDGLLVRSAAGEWRFRILREAAVSPAEQSGRPAATVAGWDTPLNLAGAEDLYAFRARAAIFGHNAPDWRTMPDGVRARYATHAPVRAGVFDETVFDEGVFDAPSDEWPGFALADAADGQDVVIDLDGAQPAILPGSWVVLRAPGVPGEAYQVVAADLSAAADFGLTAATTRLRLRGDRRLSRFGRRVTTVYVRSERLELAERPVAGLVTGPALELDGPAEPDAGTVVIITGRTADGLPYAEAARVETVSGGRMVLAAPLGRALDPFTVRVLANVVAATAGQTVDEVLGSGDAARSYQRFTLARGDLTHTTAPVPGGARDSLEVTVDGVVWTEAGSLYALGPADRAYVVRIGDDGRATAIFGDGRRGARLPSGRENVRAVYRTGLGPAGNVAAGALSLLMTRPLGVRDVTNPLPASGGAAPDQPDDLRVNAPLTVRTLDRVVSLTDHEDFARRFAGIAKARAVAQPAGPAPFVRLTLAGPGGAAVPPVTLAALRDALDRAGRPPGRLDLRSYTPLTFAVAIEVLVAADRHPTDVTAAVAAALAAACRFDVRDFARPVTAAELLTVAQGVPGVVAANLTGLAYGHDPGHEVAGVLTARGGELLTADPAGIVVREMAS
ncbi:putative baseplate assembly protein [Streptosporangiaceae bacterium NEAU-GS5]|nr:putative baseplate assembly protein [Streptosporangiaceae bacterium NEAU-GS5]